MTYDMVVQASEENIAREVELAREAIHTDDGDLYRHCLVLLTLKAQLGAMTAERDEALESRNAAWRMYHTAKAQLESMKAERDYWDDAAHTCVEDMQVLRAQLTAMTAERDEALNSSWGVYHTAQAQLAAMTVERDGLRGCLEYIAESTTDSANWLREFAAGALAEPKEGGEQDGR